MKKFEMKVKTICGEEINHIKRAYYADEAYQTARDMLKNGFTTDDKRTGAMMFFNVASISVIEI